MSGTPHSSRVRFDMGNPQPSSATTTSSARSTPARTVLFAPTPTRRDTPFDGRTTNTNTNTGGSTAGHTPHQKRSGTSFLDSAGHTPYKQGGVSSPSPMRFMYNGNDAQNNANAIMNGSSASIPSPSPAGRGLGGIFSPLQDGNANANTNPASTGLRRRNAPKSVNWGDDAATDGNDSSNNSRVPLSDRGNVVSTTTSALLPPPKASLMTGRGYSSKPSASSALVVAEKENVEDPLMLTQGDHVNEATGAVSNNQHGDWDTWVVLFGFGSPSGSSNNSNPEDSRRINTIVQTFESFGSVTRRIEHSQSSANTSSHNTSNWMCLRYATRLQAEKALCQNGSCFTTSGSRILVGVVRLSPTLARKLNVDIGGTGQTTAAARQTASTSESSSTPLKRMRDDGDKLLLNEEDVVLMPSPFKKSRGRYGLVTTILSWVFDW